MSPGSSLARKEGRWSKGRRQPRCRVSPSFAHCEASECPGSVFEHFSDRRVLSAGIRSRDRNQPPPIWLCARNRAESALELTQSRAGGGQCRCAAWGRVGKPSGVSEWASQCGGQASSAAGSSSTSGTPIVGCSSSVDSTIVVRVRATPRIDRILRSSLSISLLVRQRTLTM